MLQLAAGTEPFTEVILFHADHVTTVDASREVLAINADRNGTERVEHITTDLTGRSHPGAGP